MVRLATSLAAATAALSACLPAVLAAAPAGTVRYTFEKRRVQSRDELTSPEGVRRVLSKRQDDKVVNAPLSNLLVLYIVNITVGTPPQPLSLILDTGSSDIWFPAADSSYCQQQSCSEAGAYDREASSTFESTDYPGFQIAYVDGSETDGVYFRDTLTIGDTTVTNMTMAYAETFDRPIGIMGIGYTAGESSNSGADPFTYPNLIDVLKSQDRINTLAYSLWLDDPEANTGSILFGGVDTEKYTGELVALPVQPDERSNDYSSFTVAWTGLAVTGSGNNADMSPSSPQPAILDSGTSLTYLPNDIANELFQGLGVYSEGQEYNYLPCSYRNDDINLEFTFGGANGAKISVAINELLFDLIDYRTGQPPTIDGVEYCQFGIAPAGNYPILFGDTFLRSAYVVYDIENNEIALGQTNFNANSGEQRVQTFVSGEGIPGATSTATNVNVQQTNTGRPPINTGNADATFAASDGLPTPTLTFSSRSGAPTGGSGGSGGSGGNGGNAAGTLSADRTMFAALAVTFSAFLFGTLLI